jgi:His-Xaa-Ser system protein HxsD
VGADATEGLTFEVAERRVRFVVDESIYDLEAVMGAAYLFVDRCYCWLDRAADKKVLVVLRTREDAPSEDTLAALAGEFGNELLNQALRRRVNSSNGKIREYIMARALFSADGPSTVDRLLAELDAEEMDTPLDIPVPWAKDA